MSRDGPCDLEPPADDGFASSVAGRILRDVRFACFSPLRKSAEEVGIIQPLFGIQNGQADELFVFEVQDNSFLREGVVFILNMLLCCEPNCLAQRA
jgi:hypothetical protein